MLLEKAARLGEVRIAVNPVVAVRTHCVRDRLGISRRHELDRLALLRLRRIARAELIDRRAAARHAFVHLVADHPRRLRRGAEHAQHHIMRRDHLRHLHIRHLVQKRYVPDPRRLRLRRRLVRAPAEKVPLYAFVLRHPRRLHDVLRAVQRQIRPVIQHLERLSAWNRVLRLEHRLVRPRKQNSQTFARHVKILLAEIHVAARIPADDVRRGHHLLLAHQKLLRARFLGLPLELLQHLLVPRRDHRVEDHRDTTPMRPTARGQHIALTRHRHPHQIGLRPELQSPQKRLHVPEARPDLDEEEINLPSQLFEKRDVHAIA